MSKKSSKEILENISDRCSGKMKPYKYAKHMDYGSEKYKKGVISVLDWANELCYFYMKQEESLKYEFEKQIREKKAEVVPAIFNKEYQLGMIKGFDIVEEFIKESIDNKKKKS